jgi:hypothetical protein
MLLSELLAAKMPLTTGMLPTGGMPLPGDILLPGMR